MRITFISDTHTKHKSVEALLPGGDLIIHAGDLMNSGRNSNDISDFCKWFNGLEQYDHKVFIAGNHDRMFEDYPEKAMEIVNSYKWVDYLQDNWIQVGDDTSMVKIYGSPWQPEFYNWAFNLPRNGTELKQVWDCIPNDTDILITHGPPQTKLDTSGPPWNTPLLGCELLMERVKEVKPKIHVFGHIHGGYGYVFDGDTHYFNASVLDERYDFTNKPMTIDWNPKTNEVTFL
jgi:Icc-related predicted phosphoesterase